MINYQNRLTEMLGIRYPVIQAGMIWCSGAKLAGAAARSGILGLIGSGSMKPDLLKEHIEKAKGLAGEGQFGVNLPLLSPYADDLAGVILKSGVRVVVTAAGSPKKYTMAFKEAGMIVGHVVPSPGLALKCQQAGVDFVIAEGTEAGGHNSPAEITTMVLIPQVADAVNIPVVAAGGIGDGRGVMAALMLGAEGAQLGTRFAATQESSAALAYKQQIVAAAEDATSLLLKKVIPTRMIRNDFANRVIDLENKGAAPQELSELLGRGRAKAGIFEGDLVEGELEAGQIAGLIRDIPTTDELVRRLVAEMDQVAAKFNSEYLANNGK